MKVRRAKKATRKARLGKKRKAKIHPADRHLGLTAFGSDGTMRMTAKCSGCGERRIVLSTDWDDPSTCWCHECAPHDPVLSRIFGGEVKKQRRKRLREKRRKEREARRVAKGLPPG